MLYAAHRFIVFVYLIIPVAALILALARSRRPSRGGSPLLAFLLTAVAGIALGLALALVYAAAVGGGVKVVQVVLASYFATALLLLLKMCDFGLRRALRRIVGLRKRPAIITEETFSPPHAGGYVDGEPQPAPVPVPLPVTPPQPSPRKLFWRAQLAGVVRIVILFGIGLPYAMAAVLTYRPKVAMHDDPLSQLGYEFEDVTFRAATDDTRIAGWSIPALDPPPRTSEEAKKHWGKQTVIVCHGLAANKANQLIMARSFVPKGYNVLIFDFRAHGDSAGQLTSFGDLERRDVLGAVNWVRANHGDESQKLFGVGASMGAAALIAAAADPSTEGQSFEALAIYAGYDSLPRLARTVADDHFLTPLDWLTIHVGLPLASVQVGTDLDAFSPAELVDHVWPRPILFIHGFQDEIIRFEHGQRLFDRAPQPKERLWIWGDHNDILGNDAAARYVREFFDSAKPVPVI